MYRLFCIVLVLVVMCSCREAAPPAERERDPDEVLTGARRDAEAGRYADALEKHLWFHRHALEIKPSLKGVRLSYALRDWRELGEQYPPAREAMLRTRDEGAAQAAKGDWQGFNDSTAIDRVLGREESSCSLFLEIESADPGLARVLYSVAERALIRCGRFDVCGRFLRPDEDFREIVDRYNWIREAAGTDSKLESYLLKFADVDRAYHVPKLIGLLQAVGRQDEAERIAEAARKEWGEPSLVGPIARALQGELPPFPSDVDSGDEDEEL